MRVVALGAVFAVKETDKESFQMLSENMPQKSSKPNISVIIPMLNEASNIANTLGSIKKCQGLEVIVVDGGSTDRSVEIARSFDVCVMLSEPGRAMQMNAGASVAKGEIFLFLHADTCLPASFVKCVHKILSSPTVSAGAFGLSLGENSKALRLVEVFANLRAKIFQLPYGDQAIFLRAETFRKVNGFPNIPIMEDFELVKRLKKYGRIKISQISVVTSPRRWKSVGVWKTTAINQGIVVAYYAGVAPSIIARWYNRNYA